ncbi:MAG: TIGR00730 family Rossman fold protein [Patescibacteria group bacterium]
MEKSKQIYFTGPRIEEVLKEFPKGIEPERMHKIVEEFQRGFHFLRDFGLTASFFGSSRAKSQDRMYQEATQLASLLSKDGFAIITGGGPGIMEAANKGAFVEGGRSAGINIQLISKQLTNKYVKESVAFSYFFIRKVMLAFASDVYIFFPGGFGTLDELFELITLVQTNKIKPIPIILVDKGYWTPLLLWIEKELYAKRKAIEEQDMKIYSLVDDAKAAFEKISRMVVRVK